MSDWGEGTFRKPTNGLTEGSMNIHRQKQNFSTNSRNIVCTYKKENMFENNKSKQENIRANLCDFGFLNEFLDMTQIALETKEKIAKLISSKLNAVILQRTLLRKLKAIHRIGENICTSCIC